MTGVRQFVLFNLLPALGVGVAVSLVVLLGLRVLGITRPAYRLCLLTAPLIKSTLVLVGVQAVLLWPGLGFGAWQQQALSAGIVVPVFGLILLGTLGARQMTHRRTRQKVLAGARPATAVSPRLARALDRVMAAFRAKALAVGAACPPMPETAAPKLLVADDGLDTPLVFTSGEPTIVFPHRLADELDDREIDGALAHEVAHLQLRRPLWCSPAAFQVLTGVNPIAMVLASHFRREEEKACDDIAVAAVGRPTTYAGMLLKSYRYADRQASPVRLALGHGAGLLGWKPMIAERVERLLQTSLARSGGWRQFLSTAAVWVVIVAVFFAG